MKSLIVTADDFGVSSEVNDAVLQAHTRGILTSASLMVSGGAAKEAVRIARAHPTLRVGLHLVLVQGRSVLPRELVPELVDASGRFSDRVAWSGARYFFSPALRRQVAQECEAQVRRFLDFGLRLDHIDGHHHLHVHPTILEQVIALAVRFGAGGVRLPRQPARALPARRAAMAALMAPWVARAGGRLKAAGLPHNSEIFGLFESGEMTQAAWLRIVPHIRPGVSEAYAHPSTSPESAARELAALMSPEVAESLAAAGVRLLGYSDLPR